MVVVWCFGLNCDYLLIGGSWFDGGDGKCCVDGGV